MIQYSDENNRLKSEVVYELSLCVRYEQRSRYLMFVWQNSKVVCDCPVVSIR